MLSEDSWSGHAHAVTCFVREKQAVATSFVHNNSAVASPVGYENDEVAT